MRRYSLTACRPDNTRPVYRAAADCAVDAEHLFCTMKRFSPGLIVTIEDKQTGIVESRNT
jgi:hypothetical protein